MYVLSELLHDIIELYRLTLILLHQENTIAAGVTDLTQSTIIFMPFPVNRLEIYDSIFRGNMYNKPEVQVSLASLGMPVSLVVVCLAVRSPSPPILLLFSFRDPP